jgi:hypothetical protein
VDEGDGLENRCGRKVTEGSNPSPSANANRNACKKGRRALFAYVIWFAEAYLFDRLIPVPVLPFPVTLSLHPCVVQYLSPPVLARWCWNDPK